MFYRSWSTDQSKFNEERLQAAIVPPRHIMTKAAVSCRHPSPQNYNSAGMHPTQTKQVSRGLILSLATIANHPHVDRHSHK